MIEAHFVVGCCWFGVITAFIMHRSGTRLKSLAFINAADSGILVIIVVLSYMAWSYGTVASTLDTRPSIVKPQASTVETRLVSLDAQYIGSSISKVYHDASANCFYMTKQGKHIIPLTKERIDAEGWKPCTNCVKHD